MLRVIPKYLTVGKLADILEINFKTLILTATIVAKPNCE